MSTAESLDKPMAPLKVTCTSVDCERNLHCFLKRRGMPVDQIGCCRACGADLIDWKRVHKRNPSDQTFTFASLKNELIRHHMWHLEFDEEAVGKATGKGRDALYASIRSRLKASIGKAHGVFDGRQTPMQGNVLFYAQHATATCCRKCLSYWHDIPMDRRLTEAELDYCEGLIKGYLDERLPNLQREKLKGRQGKT